MTKFNRNTKIERLSATVHGKVQGVSYRYFTMQAARQLMLTGWVRNRFNHTVELVAEGTKEELEQLLVILNEGPRSAKITQIDTEWQTGTGEFKKFEIRMTR